MVEILLNRRMIILNSSLTLSRYSPMGRGAVSTILPMFVGEADHNVSVSSAERSASGGTDPTRTNRMMSESFRSITDERKMT